MISLMKNDSKYWIVTDLDGTLMDEDYDISPAKKTLKMFFNKTRCKLISINQDLIGKLQVKKKVNSLKKFYTLPKEAIGEDYKVKINKLINILNRKGIKIYWS